MRRIADILATAWLLTALLVVFLAPFVTVAVLISYLWGLI